METLQTPLLFPSFCPGEEGDEEIRVTVVTEEACSTAHLERSANQSTGRENGKDRQEVMSPVFPLSRVRLTDD